MKNTPPHFPAPPGRDPGSTRSAANQADGFHGQVLSTNSGPTSPNVASSARRPWSALSHAQTLASVTSCQADGLMADDDPAFGKEILNVTKAEMEAKIQPDGVSDDLGREAVALIRRTVSGLGNGHQT